MAYEYTSVVSVFTLMNSSIVIVMILSYFVLKRRYRKLEYAGAGVALIGVVTIVLSDLYKIDFQFGGTV